MDNINSTTININEIISGSLTNDNYRHVYDVFLDKNKYYFITLISNDNTEFNLRIYDDEKNIIKLKYDDKDENIYLADLNNNINDNENSKDDDEDDDYEDDDGDNDDDVDDDEEYEDEDEEDDEEYEDENEEDDEYNFNDPDILNNLILDIIGSSIPQLNPNKDDTINDPNKIEIIVEIKDNLPDENDLEALLKNNEISNNVIINFNNKMYFTPEKSGKYYLGVSSDYNYQIGDYSLNIQEVEDIKVTFNNKINLNEDIIFKSKDKFKSKKYYINLIEGHKYKVEGVDNLKFLISKNKQKIISKDNNTFFIAKFDGKYEIEVMPLKKEIECKFKIVDITSESIYNDKFQNFENLEYKKNDGNILDDNNLNNSDNIVKCKKLILCDDNNNL